MDLNKIDNDIKIINEHQKAWYVDYEKGTASRLIDQYSSFLTRIKSHDTLTILDIGGASGYFVLALREYFIHKCLEIYVVDTTEYDTWKKYADYINFIKSSAEDLSTLFEQNKFDLVFANRVFHHFVKKTWGKSMTARLDIMKKINFILKNDGHLFITDFIYNGMFFDTSASKIIYKLTSCTIPVLIEIFKKLDANSAGVGVCFLSKKMWNDLIISTGFVIDDEKMGLSMSKKWYEKFLFIKKRFEDHIFMLKKA